MSFILTVNSSSLSNLLIHIYFFCFSTFQQNLQVRKQIQLLLFYEQLILTIVNNYISPWQRFLFAKKQQQHLSQTKCGFVYLFTFAYLFVTFTPTATKNKTSTKISLFHCVTEIIEID